MRTSEATLTIAIIALPLIVICTVLQSPTFMAACRVLWSLAKIS